MFKLVRAYFCSLHTKRQFAALMLLGLIKVYNEKTSARASNFQAMFTLFTLHFLTWRVKDREIKSYFHSLEISILSCQFHLAQK